MKKGLNTILAALMLLLLSINAMAQTPPTITGSATITSAICSGTGSITINTATSAAPYNLVNSDLSSLPVGAVVGGVNHTPTFTSGNPHYVLLTPPNNDKRGFITFAETALKPVNFIATFGLYVGNGTGADGTSFNYGKVNTNNYGEAGMIDSGLAIGFNDYSNKIIIYYNNVQLQSYNVNGTLNNSNWKSVSIEVTGSGQLTLSYGGSVYCTNYQLPAAYVTDNKTNWQYGFAARCGALNNLHAVNDVVIKDRTPWEYSLDGTNFTTNKDFTNLNTGTYHAYARIGNAAYNAHGYNSTASIGTQTITALSVAATITPTNPTTCTGTGTIAISNVTHNFVPYDLVNLSLTNQQLGGAYIGNLGTCCNPYWGNGDLVLTPPTSNRAGFIAFGTNEAQPNAFSANYDVFVGGGNGGDGLSFNYGVLNTVGTAGAAESGMVNSGLAIGFSEYSNTIKIYYNKIELQSYSATLNTGGYKSVAITVTQDGKITIVHSGITICSNYQLPAAYVADNKSNWQYALAARCGGSNNYHSVKNVVIKDNDIQYFLGNGNFTTANTLTEVFPGQYTVYARKSNGVHCSNTFQIGTATITYTPDITATVASTSPTTCTTTGGTVSISNVSHGISSPYDLVNISLTNGQLGASTIGNLGTCCNPIWGGYGDLVLTPNTSNRAGYIAFNTTVAQPNAFAANYDVFVGGGNGGDGLSFNYGVLNTAGTAGAAESGMVNSGLAIGFNEYSNTIKIYYNKIELQSYSATLNTNSYKSVAITVTYDGKLTIVHGGTTICSNYQLPAAYATDNKSSWQYALAARCGASNNYHSVKNVVIKDNSIQYTINGQYYTEDPHFTNVYPATYNVRARISNGTHCSILSSLGSVTITPPPGMVAITGQPDTTTRSLKLNATATTLSVTATGADTLRYQWYSNTTANINGGPILGATSASYTPATTEGGTLYYYCKVSNACSNATSAISGGITIKTTFSESCIQAVSAGVYSSIVMKTDGSLWAWGDNNWGELGDGTQSNTRNSPVKIGTATNWKTVLIGSEHTIAIKTDGTLWAWGKNHLGQLGDGTTTTRNSPVQIGTATNWKTVLLGNTSLHTIALKTDGTLWAWGVNSDGQLGDGTTTNRLSPVQIGNATNWKSISLGYNNTVATKTDGTLWAWGDNEFGELGDGTQIDRHSPVQIGNATNWKSVSSGGLHNFAVKNDGFLWAWGYNNHGQLGDGTTTERHSPVQIGTANNWASISPGGYHTVAKKTDGSLWAWGENWVGTVGDGTQIDRYSPVQIGTDTNWASISAGYDHNLAIKTDGSLWVWGSNFQGSLGDGTSTRKYSPIKLSSCVVCTPTASTFTATACGSYTWVAKGNKVYTASNNTDTILLTNAAGCDSVVTLNLTVTQAPNAFSYNTPPNVFTQNSSITPLSPSNVSTITSGYDPYGVAVDTAGNVFVSDYDNDVIKKIDKNGNETTFYSTGIEQARGLATDKAGNVYVTNQHYNTVLKISPNGNLLNTYTGFNNPRAVAVDAAGNIYVTDNNNNKVKKINTSGIITVIGSGFVYPEAIAVDAIGNIYVGDYSGTGFGGVLKKMTTNGAISVLATGFDDMSSIAVDANDNVYVADGTNSNGVIKVVAPNGNISSIGSGFSAPTGVALDAAGNVYVADDDNYEVYKIAMSGGAVSSYSVTPSLPAGLSLNTTTGVISGTPTVASVATDYTVTAINCAGNTNAFVNITVVSACTPTTSSSDVNVCTNQLPYSWNGQSYNAAGSYTKTGLVNSQGCDSTATLNLTIGSPVTPTVSISKSSVLVCSGNEVSFTVNGVNGGSSPSYQWFKNGTIAGNGTTITFTAGTLATGDTIYCVLTANNPCQTTATVTSNKIGLTVKMSPVVTSITNGVASITTATLCTLGSTYKYYNNTPYGVWSSDDIAIASVIGGSQAGVVTANTNGSATIKYTVSNTAGCLSSASLLVKVAQQATPNAITGNSSLCAGTTIALSNTTPSGVWSSINDRGTINVSGIYAAANSGAGQVKYTVTNESGCSAFSSKTITVNPKPAVPTITYAPGTPNPQTGAPTGGFCVSKVFTVVGTPNSPTGAWSATGFASITTGGVVSVVGTGAGSIKYTYTSAAGCSNSRTMSGTGYTCARRGVVDGQLSTVNDFTMYPNPAKGYINLNVEALIGAGSIVVTDLYGKTVKTQALSMGTNTVNVSNLSKGMYFVSTITNEGKTTKKLVVE